MKAIIFKVSKNEEHSKNECVFRKIAGRTQKR